MLPDRANDHDVNALLRAAAEGDASAIERLFPLVYGELHRIAADLMRHERPEHTLQPTALVHEAYLKLVGDGTGDEHYSNHRHFVAAAAVAMRRLLVNYAKARSTEKRGGGRPIARLDEALVAFNDRSIDLLALDDALERLAALDPTQARIVELRFFGGMSAAECAGQLNLSERTVHYEWSYARAWLLRQLEAG